MTEDRTADRPSGDLDFRAEANPADPAALVALAALVVLTAGHPAAAPAGAATAVDLPVKLLARYRHTPAALPRSERAPEK